MHGRAQCIPWECGQAALQLHLARTAVSGAKGARTQPYFATTSCQVGALHHLNALSFLPALLTAVNNHNNCTEKQAHLQS